MLSTRDKLMKSKNARPRTKLPKKAAGGKAAEVRIDLRTGKRAPPWIAWPIVWIIAGGASTMTFDGVVHFHSAATPAHHSIER